MSNGHDTESDAALFRSALPIESKLERARLHLLDLTARNRLLNIPRSKTRSAKLIQTVDERSSEVYRLLVKENKAFTFIPGRVDSGDDEEEKDEVEVEDFAQPGDDDMNGRGVANRHVDTRLQTRLTSKGLQKRLLSLYLDARTLEEEQGVNVLFLALGTLKWIDPNNAANVRYAPLVLVPVSLERATAGDRFKLRWRQEDPSSNLSLEAMADRVHLLKLPVFEANDDFDITAYCEGVQEAVSAKKGWEVATDDIVLGFFSFSKFLMYRDLSPETWPAKASLAQHPLIQSLLRDGFPPVAASIGDDAPIDEELPPERLLHIVDADSSQTLAIHDARQGQNLVIQGPPGTGKSQTIANIIAGAVADGRTVLFVAEKMAALDVVKRRLDVTGIGDACLELHSNKANKRAVLEELKRTWELSSPKGTFAGNLHHRLTNARDRLNTHVERLHRVHAHAGITPYEVMGHLTRLRDDGCPPNDIHLPDAVTWSGEELRERRVLLRELCERINAIGTPDQHPWRGVGLDVVLPNQLARLLDRVASANTGLAALRQRHSEIGRSLQQPVPMSFDDVNRLYDLAERIASAPPITGDALGHVWWTQRRDDIKNLCVLGHRWQSAWEALRSSVTTDAISTDVTGTVQTLAALPSDYDSEAFRRANTLSEMLPAFVTEIAQIRALLGLDGSPDASTAMAAGMSVELVAQLYDMAERVASAPLIEGDALGHAGWAQRPDDIKNLCVLGHQWQSAWDALRSSVTADAINADLTGTVQTLSALPGDYGSEAFRRAQSLTELLPTLAIEIGRLKTALGLDDAVDTLAAASKAATTGQRVAAAPNVSPDVFAASVWDSGVEQAAELAEAVARIEDARAKADGKVLKAAWEVDTERERQVVRIRGSNFFRFLSGDWRRANALLRSMVRDPKQSVEDLLNLLDTVGDSQAALRTVRASDSLGQAAFGADWRGEKSNAAPLRALVAWMRSLRGLGAAPRLIAARIPDRADIGARANRVYQLVNQVRPMLEAFWGDLGTTAATAFDGAASVTTTRLSMLLSRVTVIAKADSACRQVLASPNVAVGERLAVMEQLRNTQTLNQSLQDNKPLGEAVFGSLWRDADSDWPAIDSVVAWVARNDNVRMLAAGLADRSAPWQLGRVSKQQLIDQVLPLLDAFWADLGTDVAKAIVDAWSVKATRLAVLLSRATDIAKADSHSHQTLARPDTSAGERLVTLEQIRNAQTLLQTLGESKPLGDAVFGSLWRGADSDWSAIDAAATWVEINDSIRTLAASLADRSAPWQISHKSKEEDSIWQAGFGGLVRDLRSELHTLFGIAPLGAIPFPHIEAKFAAWNEDSEQLSKWVAFRDRAERGKATGLTDVVERLETSRLAPGDAPDAFDMAYFEALLNDMVAQDGELGRFDGELHDRAVKDFSELDRESLRASRIYAIQAHHRKMPTKDGGVGAIGVLRGEMARRRGHMPIRKLMNEAATAIQALKPVFMMSPLSIAQFLPPARLTFDLLVMDEASQIQPVDALGAIARCKQVVVVGDERQLPPTTFFSKITEGDDEEEEDETARVSDIESILGLFRARGLPERMLRWHYRSRHQSLIAVSNSQFYENKLTIVPSPYTSEASVGLKFHHFPNGVFDSGGTGTNNVEAVAIAEAVLQHIRKHPDQSLGVATFSVRQRRAILDQLEYLRREHPETESFFHAHPTEPFFVKNLENVQGDERDVMFISVGYGQNANGVISMRFGPLGSEGGERRLNVLISRAKLRCEIFSSITDDDIDLERARGKGVAAFKLFLRYARSGRFDPPGTDRTEEADVFESQVAAALHSRGYVVHPRVGIAGLFIDLAVTDPEAPGRYVLGIECDGRSYQQARSARDRDRLRRTVLEDHGWAIHRIWSANWFHRPQEELRRLINAIESARNRHTREHHSPHRPHIMPVEMFTIERVDEPDDLLDSDSEKAGLPAYRASSVQAIQGYAKIPSVPAAQLAALVDHVVSAEGPVHFDVVVQRIRDAWGVQRAGSKIQNAIQAAVDIAVRAKAVRRTGDFLSKPGEPVVARDRSAADSLLRRPEMIAPTEWQEAVVAVVQRNFGIRKSELPGAVARWLGFSSTSTAIRELVEAEVIKAVRTGRLRQQGELLEVV